MTVSIISLVFGLMMAFVCGVAVGVILSGRKEGQVSTTYNMVMAPGPHQIYAPGAFDHWEGETVPLRGPDREIIGEATIARVDHREDGQVWIIVESELDMNHHQVARIGALMRGLNDMSFSVKPVVPHQPRRDDDVARWLKRHRDSHKTPDGYELPYYWPIDKLLDEYRTRADFGLTLDDDITQIPDYGSGDSVARRGS